MKTALPVASFSERSTGSEALIEESLGACEPKKPPGEHALDGEQGEPAFLQVWGVQLNHCETAFPQHAVSS